jgi:hypothetical protein
MKRKKKKKKKGNLTSSIRPAPYTSIEKRRDCNAPGIASSNFPYSHGYGVRLSVMVLQTCYRGVTVVL